MTRQIGYRTHPSAAKVTLVSAAPSGRKKGKAKEVHYVSGLFFFLFSLAAISLSI